jgi:AraC-like DNA-binding protein
MSAADLKPGPRGAIFDVLREELRLGFAHILEAVAVSHETSGRAESRSAAHDGGLALIFVVQGRLTVIVAEPGVGSGGDGDPAGGSGAVGGRTTALGCGEAVLLEPEPAELLLLSWERDTEHYRVTFRRSDPPPRSRRQTIEVPEHVIIRNPGRLKHLMRMLMEESRRGDTSLLVLHHLVVLMLSEMAASSRVRAEPDAREDGLESIASRVDAYIAAHYHEPIGTPDIARELRYNPDYLERAYRAERRQSIRSAIHARRFREAQAQLLLQGGRRIAEVAALCGYTDAGYFRRVFKKTTNLTPRGYRLIHAGPAAGRGDRL